MSSTSHRRQAERFAATLIVHAAWPTAVIVAGAFIACLSARSSSVAGRIASVVELASGLATLALSAQILFDAMLFRLIASHVSEAAGTAAVDDLLERMRLKPAPSRNRPLAERIAGTQRLLLKQRLSFALFVVAAFLAQR